MSALTLTTDAAVQPPEALDGLVARLERVTRSMEAITALADRLPPVAAIAADVADEAVARGQAAGIDVDQRLHDALGLLERLTAPDTMRVLGALLDRLPQLEQALKLADQLPGMVAIGVDAADELVRDLAAKGVDVERGALNGAGAALRFGALMGPAEVDSIEAMLKSGVLDPQVVGLVGRMGESFARAASAPPPPVGLGGLLRALGNPDVKRALGLLLHFAEEFGRQLGTPGAGAPGGAITGGGAATSTTAQRRR